MHFASLRDQIVALLEHQPRCLDCLAKAVDHKRDHIATVLNELRNAFRLREQAGVCGSCGEVKMAFSIGDAPLAIER